MNQAVFEKSDWIWPTEDRSCVNCYSDFIASFDLPPKPRSVRLHISADAQYCATVNGALVEGSQYADYPEYKIYDTYDITGHARAGENALCIGVYCPNENCSVYLMGSPALRFAVESDGRIVAYSGGHTLCRPSPDYISGPVERISDQLAFSFRYDARHGDGWRQPGYAARNGWAEARIVPGSQSLYPRPVKNLRTLDPKPSRILSQGFFFDVLPGNVPCGDRVQSAALAFVEAEKLGGFRPLAGLPTPEGFHMSLQPGAGDGIYAVIDLGAEESGLLDLDLSLPEETEVLIAWGEHVDDLRVRASVGGRQFCAVYQGRAGRQRFVHHFKRITGRYLQLHFYTRDLTLYYAGLRPVIYPTAHKQTPEIGDELHRRIFDVSRRTLELCRHEHFEDGPWREQALYALDFYLQLQCEYSVFEGIDFAEASLRLLALARREDGFLELCAPGRLNITIPIFSLSFVLSVCEHMRRGGEAFAREALPVVDSIMEAVLCRIAENGLTPLFPETIYWNFYEWRDGLDGIEPHRKHVLPLDFEAPLNAWLLLALTAAAELHHRLGSRRGAGYARQAEHLKQSMRVFWDEKRRVFKTRLSDGPNHPIHELTQALMVHSGAADPQQEEGLLERLADREGNGLVPASVGSMFFIYEALLRKPERYGRVVAADIARVWGTMLFHGATSFWETNEGGWAFERAGSLCHGWAGIPAYFYTRHHGALFG